MIKKVYSVISAIFIALVFSSCVSTQPYTENSNQNLNTEKSITNESVKQNQPEDFITITGKNGVYFEGIDDESFKKTRTIKVTEGPHILKLGVEKGSEFITSKITTYGYVPKKIFAVKGNDMCIESIIEEAGPATTTINGNYTETQTPLKIKYVYRLNTTERLGTTKKIFGDPEKFEVEECPKKIQILTDLPTDRKFIIVGNLKSELSGILFNFSKLKDETVYKKFIFEAYKNNIDALVDINFNSTPSNYTKSYSALGIRYID